MAVEFSDPDGVEGSGPLNTGTEVDKDYFPTSVPVTILADPPIDTDRLMFDGIDTNSGPFYSITETAKFFFARSDTWLRGIERKGIIYEGRRWLPPRTEAGDRRYTLSLVEELAHGACQSGHIQVAQLRQALFCARMQGEMYGYLPGSPVFTYRSSRL